MYITQLYTNIQTVTHYLSLLSCLVSCLRRSIGGRCPPIAHEFGVGATRSWPKRSVYLHACANMWLCIWHPHRIPCPCHVVNAKFMEGLMYTVSAVSNLDFPPVIVRPATHGAPMYFPVCHTPHPFKIVATNDLGFRSDWQELAPSDDDDWCCCWQLRAIKQIWWPADSNKAVTVSTDSKRITAKSAKSVMSALATHIEPSSLLQDLEKLRHLGADTRGTQINAGDAIRQMLETMTHHTLCQVRPPCHSTCLMLPSLRA